MNSQKYELGQTIGSSVSQKDHKTDWELAIKAYKLALTALTSTTTPIEWAETMRGLGKAYFSRLHGERSENLELAIEAYQLALTVLTPTTTPIEWAETMRDLGEIYANRLVGDHVRNVEQAVEFYENALMSTISPVERVEITQKLADLYDSSKTATSFQWAIRTYENASSIAKSVVTELIESLSAENAQVRAEAALVLGKIGDENAVPALCNVLSIDQNPKVRRSAAEALGMIGDTKAESSGNQES